MVRANSLTGRLVQQLRRVIRDQTTENESEHSAYKERLVRAYAGYVVAAKDAEELVWGAMSMCLIALGEFCEALDRLQSREIHNGPSNNVLDEQSVSAQITSSEFLDVDEVS